MNSDAGFPKSISEEVRSIHEEEEAHHHVGMKHHKHVPVGRAVILLTGFDRATMHVH